MNLPAKIGMVVSRDLSMLEKLQTVLGTEDLEDLVEVIAVDAHNTLRFRKNQEE